MPTYKASFTRMVREEGELTIVADSEELARECAEESLTTDDHSIEWTTVQTEEDSLDELEEIESDEEE